MDDLLDVLVEVGRISLMAWPEVKDTSGSFAAIFAAAAAAGEFRIDSLTHGGNKAREVFAAERKVRLEDNGLWAGNAKRRSVHLFSGKDKVLNALRDGMLWRGNRDFFGIGRVSCLTPATHEMSGAVQHSLENLGVVGGVQRDKSQALVDRRYDFRRGFVGNFAVACVAPP